MLIKLRNIFTKKDITVVIKQSFTHQRQHRQFCSKVETSFSHLTREPVLRTDKIVEEAEEFLGQGRFSSKWGLCHNFGRYHEIISLFLLKVSHINHPILHITNVVAEEQRIKGIGDVEQNVPYPLWRMMALLLITDFFGPAKNLNSSEDFLNFKNEREARVSKIIEIAYVTQIIHTLLLDIADVEIPSEMKSEAKKGFLTDLHRANKTVTLIGDLLLSQKCIHMAALKSSLATDVICSTFGSFCESEFVLGVEGKPEKFTLNQWLSKTQMGLGSLMGNLIFLNLHFNGHDELEESMKIGYLLGNVFQSYRDLSFFYDKPQLTNPSWMNLNLLPIVLRVQKTPQILQLSHPELFQIVKTDEETMQESMDKFNFFKTQAIDHIIKLNGNNETPREILLNFIQSLSPNRSQ